MVGRGVRNVAVFWKGTNIIMAFFQKTKQNKTEKITGFHYGY